MTVYFSTIRQSFLGRAHLLRYEKVVQNALKGKQSEEEHEQVKENHFLLFFRTPVLSPFQNEKFYFRVIEAREEKTNCFNENKAE